jgi:hypothetical protein
VSATLLIIAGMLLAVSVVPTKVRLQRIFAD